MAPFVQMCRAFQADQQTAQRGHEIGAWRAQHDIQNNAGPTAVTVVQMRVERAMGIEPT